MPSSTRDQRFVEEADSRVRLVEEGVSDKNLSSAGRSRDGVRTPSASLEWRDRAVSVERGSWLRC